MTPLFRVRENPAGFFGLHNIEKERGIKWYWRLTLEIPI